MSSVNNLEVQPEVQPLKKYRRSSYDKHDTKYAETLYKIYVTLNTEVKMLFDEFTDNLMDETHINRYSLLDAISDFEKKVRSKKSYESIRNENENENESISHYLWKQFAENAFNYRPYNL